MWYVQDISGDIIMIQTASPTKSLNYMLAARATMGLVSQTMLCDRPDFQEYILEQSRPLDKKPIKAQRASDRGFM